MKRQWIVWGIAMMLCGVVLTGDSVQAQLQRVEPMRVLLRSWGASGERALYIYDVTTATLDPITPLYEDRIVCVSVSPDNTRVVYKTAGRASSDRLFLLNLIDGDVREIEVRDYVSCAEWSPDSDTLIYSFRRTFEEYVVYRYDAITGVRRELFPLDISNPPFISWQPDGRYLVINDRGDLYSYDIARDNLLNLTTDDSNDEQFLGWSPVGTYITYGVGTRGVLSNLFLLDVESGFAQNITGTLGNQFGAIRWSPDGTQIAFERTSLGLSNFSDAIFVYDLEQQQIVTDIVADGANSYINNVQWSPDGTTFVYRQFNVVDYTTDLILYDVQQNNTRLLTNTPDLAEDWMRWSPDGTQIAFAGYFIDNPGRTKRAPHAPDRLQLTVDIGEPDTFVYDLATGITHQLTDTPTLRDIEVIWSPDGRYLLTRTLRVDSNTEIDLFLIDVSTGDVSPITNFPGEESFIAWLPLLNE